VLKRNPGYWQPNLPHLDALEFRPLPDTETRYATMRNGDVDMIFGGYNNELVRAAANPNLRVYYGPGNGGFFFYFNFNRPPFDNRLMREAVTRAIDLNALGASEYMDQLIGADSLFDAGSPYHLRAASDAWPHYDPAKARELVQQYVAQGGKATLSFKTSRSEVSLGEFVQAQLAAVGIQVSVQFYDLAEFTSRVVQSNDFELTSWVSAFDYPYPGVSRLLHTGGNTNFGKYSNPRVDALLDDAAATTDTARRIQDYQQVELISNQDLALLWLSRSYLSTITKPDVKGIDRYLSRDMFYATTWLDRRNG
jgi:ABC-type transport system substrate-binding protein